MRTQIKCWELRTPCSRHVPRQITNWERLKILYLLSREHWVIYKELKSLSSSRDHEIWANCKVHKIQSSKEIHHLKLRSVDLVAVLKTANFWIALRGRQVEATLNNQWCLKISTHSRQWRKLTRQGTEPIARTILAHKHKVAKCSTAHNNSQSKYCKIKSSSVY